MHVHFGEIGSCYLKLSKTKFCVQYLCLNDFLGIFFSSKLMIRIIMVVNEEMALNPWIIKMLKRRRLIRDVRRGGGCPPVFWDFQLFSWNFTQKTLKVRTFLMFSPTTQFLRCPLSFREVVTRLHILFFIDFSPHYI